MSADGDSADGGGAGAGVEQQQQQQQQQRQERQEFLAGSVALLGKFQGAPIWPCRLANAVERERYGGEPPKRLVDPQFVFFFGSRDWGWLPLAQMKMFDAKRSPAAYGKGVLKKNKRLARAVHEALILCEHRAKVDREAGKGVDDNRDEEEMDEQNQSAMDAIREANETTDEDSYAGVCVTCGGSFNSGAFECCAKCYREQHYHCLDEPIVQAVTPFYCAECRAENPPLARDMDAAIRAQDEQAEHDDENEDEEGDGAPARGAAREGGKTTRGRKSTRGRRRGGARKAVPTPNHQLLRDVSGNGADDDGVEGTGDADNIDGAADGRRRRGRGRGRGGRAAAPGGRGRPRGRRGRAAAEMDDSFGEDSDILDNGEAAKLARAATKAAQEMSRNDKALRVVLPTGRVLLLANAPPLATEHLVVRQSSAAAKTATRADGDGSAATASAAGGGSTALNSTSVAADGPDRASTNVDADARVSGAAHGAGGDDGPPAGATEPCGFSFALLQRKLGERGLSFGAAAISGTQDEEEEEEEDHDVCFVCHDGGDLLMCDFPGCACVYHACCVRLHMHSPHVEDVWGGTGLENSSSSREGRPKSAADRNSRPASRTSRAIGSSNSRGGRGGRNDNNSGGNGAESNAQPLSALSAAPPRWFCPRHFCMQCEILERPPAWAESQFDQLVPDVLRSNAGAEFGQPIPTRFMISCSACTRALCRVCDQQLRADRMSLSGRRPGRPPAPSSSSSSSSSASTSSSANTEAVQMDVVEGIDEAATAGAVSRRSTLIKSCNYCSSKHPRLVLARRLELLWSRIATSPLAEAFLSGVFPGAQRPSGRDRSSPSRGLLGLLDNVRALQFVSVSEFWEEFSQVCNEAREVALANLSTAPRAKHHTEEALEIVDQVLFTLRDQGAHSVRMAAAELHMLEQELAQMAELARRPDAVGGDPQPDDMLVSYTWAAVNSSQLTDEQRTKRVALLQQLVRTEGGRFQGPFPYRHPCSVLRYHPKGLKPTLVLGRSFNDWIDYLANIGISDECKRAFDHDRRKAARDMVIPAGRGTEIMADAAKAQREDADVDETATVREPFPDDVYQMLQHASGTSLFGDAGATRAAGSLLSLRRADADMFAWESTRDGMELAMGDLSAQLNRAQDRLRAIEAAWHQSKSIPVSAVHIPTAATAATAAAAAAVTASTIDSATSTSNEDNSAAAAQLLDEGAVAVAGEEAVPLTVGQSHVLRELRLANSSLRVRLADSMRHVRDARVALTQATQVIQERDATIARLQGQLEGDTAAAGSSVNASAAPSPALLTQADTTGLAEQEEIEVDDSPAEQKSVTGRKRKGAKATAAGPARNGHGSATAATAPAKRGVKRRRAGSVRADTSNLVNGERDPDSSNEGGKSKRKARARSSGGRPPSGRSTRGSASSAQTPDDSEEENEEEEERGEMGMRILRVDDSGESQTGEAAEVSEDESP